MKNIKTSFASFKQAYYQRKARFNEAFTKALDKGYISFNQQGREIMSQIEYYIKEIEKSDIFEKTASSASEKSAKKSLSKAKKLFKQLNEMIKPMWRQWIEAIVIAFVLAFVLRNFIFGLYHVPTGSAEKNILVGDRVWGNKAAYLLGEVKRGDLVIFDNPEFHYVKSNIFHYYWQKYIGLEFPPLGLGAGPDNFVKRVIGIPGDVVEGKIEDGKTVIYRNGKKLNEPYVNRLPLISLKKQVGFIPFKAFGPFSVPFFLQKRFATVRYTYDPDKPLDQQPWYNMEESEIIIKPGSDEKILYHAYDPIYTMGSGMSNFIYSVDKFGPITVPEGKYWVMGDSRQNSRDSRYFNFLDEDLIHGRASFVIYSVDSEEAFWLFELIKHPIDFWTKKIRYNRFFKGLGTFNGIEE